MYSGDQSMHQWERVPIELINQTKQKKRVPVEKIKQGIGIPP